MSYRYGFNGKEKDADGEWGSNTHYDYGFRIYNPAIAKFLSVDPLTQSYPWYTPYQFAGNKPIKFIDLDGLEEYDPAAKPTGVTLISNAKIPYGIEHPERSITAGKYQLVPVTNSNGAVSYWRARTQTKQGSRDDFIVGPFDFPDFKKNINKYSRSANVYRWGIELGGGKSMGENYKDIVTDPVNWVAGAGVVASLKPRPGRSSVTPMRQLANAADDAVESTVSVFHKGELVNGKVSSGKALSTGLDKAGVEALDRAGGVHQFDIPKSVYDDWIDSGKAQTRKDYDFNTGTVNDEIRFSGDVSGSLNQYKVNNGGGG